MKRRFINLQTRNKLLLCFGGLTLVMGIIIFSLNMILTLRAGAQGVFRKPLILSQVAEELRKVLGDRGGSENPSPAVILDEAGIQ